MAYPRSFLRHTLLWDLPGGEKAATSYSWDNGAGVTGLDTTTEAAFQTRGESYWDAIKDAYSDETLFVGSRLSWIAVDGTTVASTDLAQASEGGTSTAPVLPTEVAIVVSLRTNLGTRRGRGRSYLPGTHSDSVASGGYVLPAVQAILADGAQDYLADITVGASTYVPVVASPTGGLLTPVISLRVGNVFDAQRRRRDKLVETWENRPL